MIQLSDIRIVLVNTSHPGNIGSAARAMKTMGLTSLYLVQPAQYPHPKALEMASNAGDVLANAVVTDTLQAAIADCHLVIGASARNRTIPWPYLTPRALTQKLQTEAPDTKIAILFGREQSGLTNEELHACHFHMQIPANPDYPSLNLAAAVQVVAYELRMAALDENDQQAGWDYQFANADEMEKLFQHLEKVLIKTQFLKPSAPRQLMTRLRRFFLRARIDVMEMNIWRGFLKAVEDSTEGSAQ